MLRSLAGGTLFGEVWGPVPAPVLALHGWGRSHDDFAGAFGAVGDRLAVVAPDLPGFGATPPPGEPWGSEEYAAALLALFAPEPEPAGTPALRSPVVVVGHSFGGRVAVTLAARYPERVAALVLSGVPLLRPPGRRARVAPAYRVVRRLRRLGLVSEDRLERARRRHGSADYRDAQGVMRAVLVKLLSEHYEEALTSLRCPVELVWSDDDIEAPMAVASAVQHLVPHAVVTRCGPVGHLTPLTAAIPLRQAVERALVIAPG